MDLGTWMWLSALAPIVITIAVVLLFLKLFAGRGQSKQQQKQAMQLTQTGRKARATILRVEPTGMVVNNINIQCWVTFRLQPLDGGPITEGRKKILINQVQMPRAGDVWPAWIDPTDPQEFAVGMPQGADPSQIPLFREFGIPHPLDNRTASTTDDPVDDLQRLVDMKQQGMLTDDEFRAAKAKLLGDL